MNRSQRAIECYTAGRKLRRGLRRKRNGPLWRSVVFGVVVVVVVVVVVGDDERVKRRWKMEGREAEVRTRLIKLK